MAEPGPYRPLSLLAIAGFAVTCLWLVVLIVLVIGALGSGAPLPMNAWVVSLPLAGTLLAVVGWFHIQRSEGSRAGTSLASWAVFLCVISGLGYLAYWAGTRWPVQQQATAFTQEWFEQLKKGEDLAAFRLTIDPDRRPSSTITAHSMRRTLESQFNTLGSEMDPRGLLTRFRQDNIIRFILQGGAETEITALGVTNWDYREQGYRVQQHYRVSTPEGSWDMLITVQSNDGEGRGRPGGRQWYVVGWKETGPTAGPTLKPLGERMDSLRKQSRQSLERWLRALPDRSASNGSGISVDDKEFWAAGHLRTFLPLELKRLFGSPDKNLASQVQVKSNLRAHWDRGADSLRIEHDVELGLPPLYGEWVGSLLLAGAGQPDFPATLLSLVGDEPRRTAVAHPRLVHGTLVTETKTSDEQQTWKVVGVRLIHGRAR